MQPLQLSEDRKWAIAEFKYRADNLRLAMLGFTIDLGMETLFPDSDVKTVDPLDHLEALTDVTKALHMISTILEDMTNDKVRATSVVDVQSKLSRSFRNG
jgi:hypothetical protein